MLDSLVRVSRRVGWGADRIAADPTHMTRDDPRLDRSRSESTVNSPPQSDGRKRAGARAAAGNSSVHQPADDIQGYNTRDPEAAGHLPSDTSDGQRTGRGALPAESAPAGARCAPDQSRRSGAGDDERTARLNSAGRLCGPIRLPLSGFTYS